MSGLVRRVIITATAAGLLLQPQHHSDQQKSLLIDYKTQRFAEYVAPKQSPQQPQHRTQLDVHGLIGVINVANLSYLIAITKREEVAQIAGKPIYLVADVALLPLTSQQEADDAIKEVLASSSLDFDTSDTEDSDAEDDRSIRTTNTDLDRNSADDGEQNSAEIHSDTGVAQEVATGNVSFGRFATRWLLRQKWPAPRSNLNSTNLESTDPEATRQDENKHELQLPPDGSQAQPSESNVNATPRLATLGLMPRILKTTKMIFTCRSYFFSYDIDLTRKFEEWQPFNQKLALRNLDPLYFWNRKLGAKFIDSSFNTFLTPVVQGFIGQRAFMLTKPSKGSSEKTEVTTASEDTSQHVPIAGATDNESFLLTLISRRSTKRSGLRYLRRGIDDEGNCANFVETEQILSSADWDPSKKIRTFVQVRGSIPLYFSQSPYSFKPIPNLQNSPQMNQKAFNKHFSTLRQQYGAVQVAALIDRHATEKTIGEAYEETFNRSEDQRLLKDVSFTWFDFHAECRGMKFENVSRLVDQLSHFLRSSSETVIQNGNIVSRQSGVIRTNCMDCLDRTNVAQSAFAQQMLQSILSEEGYTLNFTTDPSTNWFNTLWADNGDAISRLYAGTAALKGDYTRTRKRNWRGAINDLGLTLTRYYGNMVNDYFSQTVIDMLLGSVSWRVFEDFESSMKSADPGISLSMARESVIETASKMVIVDPEQEDLLQAWTMMVPAVENTLRTLPMEEAIVLLSDSALYVCRMNWATEKVARVEHVDLRSIRKIKIGTYVVSTFTEVQLNEDKNQGILVYYAPCQQGVVRVNTRTLSTRHETLSGHGAAEDGGRQGVDGGTGILSWLTAPVTQDHRREERMLALKVIMRSDDDAIEGLAASKKPVTETPKDVAEQIADEIRRAITGSTEYGEQRGGELIERSQIIGAEEAKKRTGYLEQVGWRVKKMVWA